MKRKYVLSIVALAVVAILGVGMVSAFGNGFGSLDFSKENKVEMQEQMDALNSAIENGDYESWKSLMEERIAKMQEQLTEENFNKLIEGYQEMEERRAEMQEKHEAFCEEDECHSMNDEEMHKDFRGHPGPEMFDFRKPFVEKTTSE